MPPQLLNIHGQPIAPRRRLTARQGSDSHPVQFRSADIETLAEAQSRWLSNVSPLDYISVEVVRRCITDFLRGAYAEQQWLWCQLEMYDPMLSVCVTNRESALKEYTWLIDTLPDLDDGDQVLAEAQQRTVQDLFAAIRNVDEAWQSLAEASRRHYKYLQPYEDSDGLHLLPVDNWLFVRDGHAGPWGWNPSATFGRTRGEVLPVDYDDLVKRVCPRPLNLSAQMLCLNRQTTLAQWDVFLGRYGTPPIFLVLPEGIGEDVYKLYQQAALKCISNATGVLPAGSDLKSPTVPTTSVDLFDRRLRLANEELVMLYTGSILTMMTAPGDGTNTETGSSHQSTYDRIVLGEAEDIAAVMTEQLVHRVLDQYHPGQPKLVRFALARDRAETPQEAATVVQMLRASGYDLDDQEVSDRSGWRVVKGVPTPSLYESKTAGYVPTQRAIEQLSGMPMRPVPTDPYTLTHCRDALTRTLCLHRTSTLWPPARRTLEATVSQVSAAIDARLACAAHAAQRDATPLTETELATLRALAGGALDPDMIARESAAAEAALKRAVASVRDNGPQSGGNPVANPLQNANLPDPENS